MDDPARGGRGRRHGERSRGGHRRPAPARSSASSAAPTTRPPSRRRRTRPSSPTSPGLDRRTATSLPDQGFSTKTETCSIIARTGPGVRPGRGRDPWTMWSTCAGRWRWPPRSAPPRRPTRGSGCRASCRGRWLDRQPVRRGHGAARRPPRRGHGAAPAAGEAARGATLYTTLEPCAHHGRTPPCTDAIIEAGVARVVVGVEDPDPQVAGRGAGRAAAAGIDVTVGVAADEVAEQLAPYLKHRTTGQPWVSSRWRPAWTPAPPHPTGPAAGSPARRPAATSTACGPSSDAVLVGAGTVRADDPELTVRLEDGGRARPAPPGRARAGRRRRPGSTRPSSSRATSATSWTSSGAAGCSSCWSRGAPRWPTTSTPPAWSTATCCTWRRLFFGGDDARPLFAGPGAGTIGDVWKGRLVSVETLGEDLRVEVAA